MSTPNVSRLRAQGQADSLNATDIMWVQQGEGSGADKYATIAQIIEYLTGGLGSLTMTGRGGTAVLTNGSLTFTRVNPGEADDGQTVKVSWGNGIEVGNNSSRFVKISDGKIRVYHVVEGTEHDDFVFDLFTLTTKNIVGTTLNITGVLEATAQALGFYKPETHTGTENHSGTENHTGDSTFQKAIVHNLDVDSNSSFTGIEAHNSTEYHRGTESHSGTESHTGRATFGQLLATVVGAGGGVFEQLKHGIASSSSDVRKTIHSVSSSGTSIPAWAMSDACDAGQIKIVINGNTALSTVSFGLRMTAGQGIVRIDKGKAAYLVCIDNTSYNEAVFAVIGASVSFT